MPRILGDWIKSYLDYTAGTEAPRMMHFYVAVSTLAGALRRHVWVDMRRFKWFPNFYIALVAPPGIISKTTTMDHGIDLLKKVPGIRFGPDVITWEALVKKFAESLEEFRYTDAGGDLFIPQSALTLASGEWGNLIDPHNKAMVNLYIALWDGRAAFDKETKMSGNDAINAPWINMIGCTTPHWIADNFPASMIGGGFTSRCIFVYADQKEQLIPWPDEAVDTRHEDLAAALVADLEYIAANVIGPMELTPAARDWGREWYQNLWTVVARQASDEQLQGYIARKQGHLVKLAMILSIARDDSRIITDEHLRLAEIMLKEAEATVAHVFAKIGRSQQSEHADRLVEFVKRHGPIAYKVAFRHVIAHFPDAREFEGVLKGLMDAGILKFASGTAMITPDAKLIYCGGDGPVA